MLFYELEKKLKDAYPDDDIKLESDIDAFTMFLYIKFNGLAVTKLSSENIQDNMAIYGEDFMEKIIFNKIVEDIEEIKSNYFR